MQAPFGHRDGFVRPAPSVLWAAGLYSPSCACGGIGRRARLRALWREFSVEVRVLSGAPWEGQEVLLLGLWRAL